MSDHLRALRRLPRLAALVALATTFGAGTLALAALWALGLWTPGPERSPLTLVPLVPFAAAVLAGSIGGWWWVSRYTRRVKHAADTREQELTGRAQRSLMEASQRNAYAAVGDFATELARASSRRRSPRRAPPSDRSSRRCISTRRCAGRWTARNASCTGWPTRCRTRCASRGAAS